MSAGGVSLRNNVASTVVNIAAVFRSDFVYIPACWPVEFVRTGVENEWLLLCFQWSFWNIDNRAVYWLRGFQFACGAAACSREPGEQE